MRYIQQLPLLKTSENNRVKRPLLSYSNMFCGDSRNEKMD
jgi:hypothetical protein